jgi:UDP-N-acetylglucosamine--N-acetylmuramyl-(pentapeptide) pyrophosphoryl-undecaprenol N-acetylglucosamine transferase
MISGGGTGGHIFPAVAIADALKASGAILDILFIGALGRMEMEKVPAAGYKITGLPVAGIQRSASFSNLLLPFRIIISLFRAFRLIRVFKPDVAIGTGGYASGPVLFVASLLRIPTLIQEQNAFAGITNKILGKRADRICVAYDGMEQFFPAEAISITGNPTRASIAYASEQNAAYARKVFGLYPDKKTILVMGGSLGARTINKSLLKDYHLLLQSGYQLIWQTGKIYYNEFRAAIPEKEPEGIALQEFIKDIDKAYAAADLIISRSGAISISELCIAGKPVVLVPSPNVAEDHQTKNALALVEKKAAIMIRDVEAEEKLVPAVLALAADQGQCIEMSANIKALARPDATAHIAEEVWTLIKNKEKK